MAKSVTACHEDDLSGLESEGLCKPKPMPAPVPPQILPTTAPNFAHWQPTYRRPLYRPQRLRRPENRGQAGLARVEKGKAKREGHRSPFTLHAAARPKMPR